MFVLFPWQQVTEHQSEQWPRDILQPFHFTVEEIASEPVILPKPFPVRQCIQDNTWVFQSPLSPSHTFFFPLRFDLGFLFLHTLAWQWLCQPLPAPTPQSGVGYRRAKVHFPKRVFFTFWQVKRKGTQTSQSHSIQTAHWKTQNPVSKSLSFTFQVLILIGFEFCSYSVIKYLQNLD